MEERLQELRREFELGRQQMAQLERKRDELRDTLLRISGAIQVLEELSAVGERPVAEDAVVRVPA
jgi:hypothetical protein